MYLDKYVWCIHFISVYPEDFEMFFLFIRDMDPTKKTAFEPFLWMASFVSGIYPLKYGSLIQENYHHHEPVDPEGIHSI